MWGLSAQALCPRLLEDIPSPAGRSVSTAPLRSAGHGSPWLPWATFEALPPPPPRAVPRSHTNTVQLLFHPRLHFSLALLSVASTPVSAVAVSLTQPRVCRRSEHPLQPQR